MEEFVDAEEFTYDTICARGEVLVENICQYHPRPLMTKMHEWISPITMAQRDLDAPGLQGGRELGRAVLKALGFRDGFTHMEWYRKADGEVVFGEIGARPPGARTVDVMNYATDADLYRRLGPRGHPRAASRIRSSGTTTPAASSSGPTARAGSPTTRTWTACWPNTATMSPPWTCCPIGAPRRDWRATTVSDGMVIVRHPELATAMEIAQRFAADLQLYAA